MQIGTLEGILSVQIHYVGFLFFVFFTFYLHELHNVQVQMAELLDCTADVLMGERMRLFACSGSTGDTRTHANAHTLHNSRI